MICCCHSSFGLEGWKFSNLWGDLSVFPKSNDVKADYVVGLLTNFLLCKSVRAIFLYELTFLGIE